MKVFNTSFTLSTEDRCEVSDITKLIREVIQQSPVANGIALINTLHTTCALFINEFQSALIDDLEANHPGIKERLVDEGDLRRFVNVYINDEDVRFIGGLEAELSDGDQVVVLPAVAGG